MSHLKKILFLIVCVSGFVHEYSVFRSYNRILNSLELELQAFVKCLLWVLGTGLEFFGRGSTCF